MKRALALPLDLIRRSRSDGRLTTFRDRYWLAAVLSWCFLPMPLLLRLFGSDKQRPGEHAYGRTYANVMVRYRLRRMTLLEIGILSGASLLAWRAVFPFGRIIGCDIEPKPDQRVGALRIHQTDQGSEADLAQLVKMEKAFDVIIDDGSHLSGHQIFSFQHLFPHVNDGGVYIIEDVQTSYWPVVPGGADFSDPAFAQSCMGYFLGLSKYINHAEFLPGTPVDDALVRLAKEITSISFHHNLIIIRKGDNDLPSNYRHLAHQVAEAAVRQSVDRRAPVTDTVTN